MPRKKFNREEADRIWQNYTKQLVDSISSSEKEGIERGYSSYEIEAHWQNKMKEKPKDTTNDEGNATNPQ